MRKKLSLESLSVDTFETGTAETEDRGTVRGNAAGCTCVRTCLCRTANYNCGTGPYTIYSCDYTHNDSCGYDTSVGCETWQIECA